MHSTPRNELLILPSLAAHRSGQGGLVLTQKFINGVAQFAVDWPGRVSALIRLRDTPTSDMDHVEAPGHTSRLRFEIRPSEADDLRARIQNAAAVLAFLSPFELPTARLCAELRVPLIFWSEFSPRTEAQIVDAETENFALRLRRKLWILQAERKRRRMVRLAAGIQCSGIPAYDAYKGFNQRALLFFDNRVPQLDVIDIPSLESKIQTIHQKRPLRLVFGGRLVAMKGVMHLPLVAEKLRQLGILFQLDIYGDGILRDALFRDIAKRKLEHCVALRGVLDFEKEWIPTLKAGADIFICCHPQGDPSSTYPEVMSCGVAIVGYANEAFAGIVEQSGSGWLSPVNDPHALAEVVARLAENRTEIARGALKAREFAETHCFERTFSKRAKHLVSLSRLSSSPAPAGSA